VDRERRVRFYRGEFPFSMTVGGRDALTSGVVRGSQRNGLDTGEVELKESTPEGRRIEDYLTTILKESY